MYRFERNGNTEEFTLIRNETTYPGYTPETVCRYIAEDMDIIAGDKEKSRMFMNNISTSIKTWGLCINLINKSVMEDIVESLKATIEAKDTCENGRKGAMLLLINLLIQADNGCIGAAEIGIDLITGWLACLPAYIGTKDINYFYSSMNDFYHDPKRTALFKEFWTAPEDFPDGWINGERRANAATLPAYYAQICKSFGDDDYDDYIDAFREYAEASHSVTEVFPDTLSIGRITDEHGRTQQIIPENAQTLSRCDTISELERIAKDSPYPGIAYQCRNTLQLMAQTDWEAYREAEKKVKLLKKINPSFNRKMYQFDSEEEKIRVSNATRSLGGFSYARHAILKRIALAIIIPFAILGIIAILRLKSVQTFLIVAGLAAATLYGLSTCDTGYVGTSEGLAPFFIWRK